MKRNNHLENRLINIVNTHFNVDVKRKGRDRSTIDARSVACKILYDQGYSKVNIAKVLNQHHATIIHTLKMFSIYLNQDPMLRFRYDECRQHFADYKEDGNFSIFDFTNIESLRNEILRLKIENKSLINENKSLITFILSHALRYLLQLLEIATQTLCSKHFRYSQKLHLLLNHLKAFQPRRSPKAAMK